MALDILDLINRLQAENENLKLDIAELEAKNFVKDKLLAKAEAKLEEAEDTIQYADKELKKAEAENKRLISGKCVYLSDDETTEYCVEGICPKYKTEAQIKAEAYKEFWNSRPERLNEQCEGKEEYNKGWNACLDEFWEIRNNLFEELVGDSQ